MWCHLINSNNPNSWYFIGITNKQAQKLVSLKQHRTSNYTSIYYIWPTTICIGSNHKCAAYKTTTTIMRVWSYTRYNTANARQIEPIGILNWVEGFLLKLINSTSGDSGKTGCIDGVRVGDSEYLATILAKSENLNKTIAGGWLCRRRMGNHCIKNWERTNALF